MSCGLIVNPHPHLQAGMYNIVLYQYFIKRMRNKLEYKRRGKTDKKKLGIQGI